MVAYKYQNRRWFLNHTWRDNRSCHDIGRGMNEVVKTTIELHDAKDIDINAAKKIIASCAIAINWCDGNEYEATAYIRRYRCGKCLKMIPRDKNCILSGTCQIMCQTVMILKKRLV